MNLPNKLTMARIIAIPFFVVFFCMGMNLVAGIIFIVAALTDMLDGKIARSRNLVTNFGKLMDPLADKLLTMAAFVCLVATGQAPAWVIIIILGRELAVSGLRQLAAAEGVVMAADMSGKIKTVFQMVAVVLLVWQDWPFSYFITAFSLGNICLYIALALTIVSGVEYFVKNWHVVVSKGL